MLSTTLQKIKTKLAMTPEKKELLTEQTTKLAMAIVGGVVVNVAVYYTSEALKTTIDNLKQNRNQIAETE